MFNQKELEELLFLVKSIPLDDTEIVTLVLFYIKKLEEEIAKCQKK